MEAPFLARGERITPLGARRFSEEVHSGGGHKKLYRVFSGRNSARVSAHTCARLDVFEGLRVQFVIETVSPGGYGVFGLPADSSDDDEDTAQECSSAQECAA